MTAGFAGARTPAEDRLTPAAEPLAGAVFALLVLACFAAFFVTQRLKHTPTAVQSFHRTPTFSPLSTDPERRQERIAFKLAHAERVSVAIVDSSLDVVATLVSDYPVARYKPFSLRWDGHRGRPVAYHWLVSARGYRTLVPVDGGAPAPPGEYRVRWTLSRQSQPVYSPEGFKLERE